MNKKKGNLKKNRLEFKKQANNHFDEKLTQILLDDSKTPHEIVEYLTSHNIFEFNLGKKVLHYVLFVNEDDALIDFVNTICIFTNSKNSLIITPGLGKILNIRKIDKHRSVICETNLLKKIYSLVNDRNEYIVGNVTNIELNKKFDFIYLNLLNIDTTNRKRISILDRTLGFLKNEGVIFVVLSSSQLDTHALEQILTDNEKEYQLLMVIDLPLGFIPELPATFQASILIIKKADFCKNIFQFRRSKIVDFDDLFNSFKNKDNEFITEIDRVICASLDNLDN